MINFRAAARVLTAGALIALAASAAAQGDYPNRPVRLVSGYAPGGTTSLVGRLIGGQYAEVLKAAMAWNIETIATLRKKGVKFDF